jgi:hypothetical protein
VYEEFDEIKVSEMCKDRSKCKEVIFAYRNKKQAWYINLKQNYYKQICFAFKRHYNLHPASESTLSRWSRLHLQSLAPTNPHWARVVGYGPFSLCVIHKEGLCLGSGDINRLMKMTIYNIIFKSRVVSGTK